MSGSDDNWNRRRELSEKEADLWARIAETAKPLRKGARIVSSAKAAKAASAHADKEHADHIEPKPITSQPRLKKPAAKKVAPPLAKFDHKKARKIAKGQDDIDARIDLHGMRQAEAYGALKSFLIRSQASDKRNVLVITGKGSTRRQDEDMSWFESEQPGVLKRMLPIWLTEADLRTVVVSYTEAHARHGGSGAYYVRLRKLGK